MQRGPAQATPAHSANIEFELAEGRLIGSIALDGGRPARFEGFDELERMIGSIPSQQRPLVLVRAADARAPDHGLAELTPREREIAVAAASGATNREIADSKYYSVKSIEAYLTRVYRKLAISGRDELAAMVEDLEVPEGLGDDLTGGRPGQRIAPLPDRPGGRRASVELLVYG